MTNEVADSRSHPENQIETAVRAIGRSTARRKVFEAIYHHKAKVKTVGEIAKKTRLSRMRVLQEGRHLHSKGVVMQTRRDSDTAYAKIDFYHAHKRRILALVSDPKKLTAMVDKRRPKVIVNLPKSVAIPSAGAKVKRVYIDDFAAFAKAKKVKGADSLPPEVSEDQFKSGVQAIIDEPGQFKDWGGERSDLYTTRLHFKGKRLSAAFAFKGPGLKGKLVLGKMGKNGDQLPRLLQEEADVFFVQHWREIDPLVIKTMRNLVVAKSVTTGKPLWFGTIDGKDSHRLYLAYPAEFTSKTAKKKRK
jgi:hypothetical protein